MATGYPVTIAPVNVVMAPIIFGESPLQVTCGNCRNLVVTSTTGENGACAYISAVIVFLICCPCFWVPLVMDSCKDVIHTCPACGTILGNYKRL